MPYPKGKPRRDLTGERFGRLVVQRSTGRSWRGNIVWECLCDCGTVRHVPTVSLSTGNTTSCGCLTKERQHSAVSLPEGQAAFNRVYRIYLKNAEKTGKVFNLTKEQFREITSGHCFYCGVEPKQVTHELQFNGVYAHNGIDRVNAEIGYVYENCVPCCKRCNRAKDRMTQQEFADLICDIYEHFIMQTVLENIKGQT